MRMISRFHLVNQILKNVINTLSFFSKYINTLLNSKYSAKMSAFSVNHS